MLADHRSLVALACRGSDQERNIADQGTHPMNVLYRFQGLGKSFPDGSQLRWAFRNMDGRIGRGEFTAIWGPSGSGKTTLLRILACLDDPSEGSVRLQLENKSIELATLSESNRLNLRRNEIGFVFQFFNLFPNLTVAENLQLPPSLAGRKLHVPSARELLARLGLDTRLGAFPNELSGGEQQRVAIARALSHRPSVVLADEPTGNLDRDNTELVGDLLVSLCSEFGTTLVVATHNESLKARADSVIAMNTAQARP